MAFGIEEAVSSVSNLLTTAIDKIWPNPEDKAKAEAMVMVAAADAAVKQMALMVRDIGRMYRERNEALQEVARAHHDALFRLALAAEYRDDDTGAHIVRMGFLAEALALAAGADAYLAKPFSPLNLIDTTNNLSRPA